MSNGGLYVFKNSKDSQIYSHIDIITFFSYINLHIRNACKVSWLVSDVLKIFGLLLLVFLSRLGISYAFQNQILDTVLMYVSIYLAFFVMMEARCL